MSVTISTLLHGGSGKTRQEERDVRQLQKGQYVPDKHPLQREATSEKQAPMQKDHPEELGILLLDTQCLSTLDHALQSPQ